MKKVYRSKVGLELLLPISAVFLFVTVAAVLNGKAWPMILVMAPIMAFVYYTLFATSYTIHNNQLDIRCGFLYFKTIAISEIHSIKPSRNILSSPASSLDRLEIRYGKNNFVLISPRDKESFIASLQVINASIEVKSMPSFVQ